LPVELKENNTFNVFLCGPMPSIPIIGNNLAGFVYFRVVVFVFC